MIHVPRKSNLVPIDILKRAEKASRELVSHLSGANVGTVKIDQRVLLSFKKPLEELFHDKCAYCESHLQTVAFGVVEAFRPKSIYWWLAYEWENMLLSCEVCNVAKANRFPIMGKVAKPGVRGRDLLAEQPLLLDPCLDLPEEHLAFKERGEVVGLTPRGEASIDVLHLNRSGLVDARRRAIENALLFAKRYFFNVTPRRAEEFHEELSGFIDEKREYAGAVRQALRAMSENAGYTLSEAVWTPVLREIQKNTRKVSAHEIREADKNAAQLMDAQRRYSVESPNREQKNLYKRSAKRIEQIEFDNFRVFESLELSMPQVTRNYETWLMLIGENGLGKTSILQGLALALMGQKRANQLGLDARQCVRRASGVRRGCVRVSVTGVGDIKLSFNSNSPRFLVDPPEPKIPLRGYGATRLLPRQLGRKASRDRYIRVTNLFDPTVPLSDANAWLLRQKHAVSEAFEEVRDAFSKLVPDEAILTEDHGKITLSTKHGEHRLSELSAGYEATLALIVDIAIGTSGQWTSIQEAEGIVLLDEVEAHLHPQWRLTIVDGLRKAFPHLFFIATTHDPLCLKGLDDGEIDVLRRNEQGTVVAETHMPSVHDLPADQILTSELFDLPSTRNAASPIAIARFSTLLAKPRRSQAEEDELGRLQEHIAAQFSAALTPMQREIEGVVTATLEKMRNKPLPKDAVAEIRRQVLALGSDKHRSFS